MRSGVWVTAVSYCLNGTELSQEEFEDNICLRYGLLPMYLTVAFDGYGKKFTLDHAWSFPEGGLVIY